MHTKKKKREVVAFLTYNIIIMEPPTIDCNYYGTSTMRTRGHGPDSFPIVYYTLRPMDTKVTPQRTKSVQILFPTEKGQSHARSTFWCKRVENISPFYDFYQRTPYPRIGSEKEQKMSHLLSLLSSFFLLSLSLLVDLHLYPAHDTVWSCLVILCFAIHF